MQGEEEPNAYEQQRAQRVQQNARRLEELGLLANPLSGAAEATRAAGRAQRRAQRAVEEAQLEPTRRSRRQRGEVVESVGMENHPDNPGGSRWAGPGAGPPRQDVPRRLPPACSAPSGLDTKRAGRPSPSLLRAHISTPRGPHAACRQPRECGSSRPRAQAADLEALDAGGGDPALHDHNLMRIRRCALPAFPVRPWSHLSGVWGRDSEGQHPGWGQL